MSTEKKHSAKNPFIIYGYAGPQYFCDRKEETEKIVTALHNGRNITLIAPRRIGKTGLIKNVFHQISSSEKDSICIYMDIFSTRNTYEFVQLFGKNVLEGMQTKGEQILSKISTIFSNCRPTFSIDSVTGTPTISIDIVPSQEVQTLNDIFNYLGKSGKECYIAIDEFQQITQYPEQGTEALLRSYIQFLPNVHFIFAGSSQHIMTEMFISAKRPFYQSTQLISLHPINEETYYHFASNFFELKGGGIREEIFHSVYSRFNGYTWYIQNILNRLYEENDNVESQSVADFTIAALIAENTPLYQALLSLLPDKQLVLLKAIAQEGAVVAPNNGAFINRYKLKAASSVSSALNALLDKELAYKSDHGYIVYDRFLNLWLKEYQ